MAAALFLLLLAFVATREFVVEAYNVSGESMEPTLHPGDIVVVDKMPASLEVGDVVVASRHGSTFSLKGRRAIG